MREKMSAVKKKALLTTRMGENCFERKKKQKMHLIRSVKIVDRGIHCTECKKRIITYRYSRECKKEGATGIRTPADG